MKQTYSKHNEDIFISVTNKLKENRLIYFISISKICHFVLCSLQILEYLYTIA